jgi:hypothetical protein
VSDDCRKSSWVVTCNHGGCKEMLTLSRVTTAQLSTEDVDEDERQLDAHEDDWSWSERQLDAHEDDWRWLSPALSAAAVFLGWRLHASVMWCPTHTVAMKLSCRRCLIACPDCSCMGGPLLEAVTTSSEHS